VVAAQDNVKLQVHQQIEAFARIRTVADQVPQAVDLFRPLLHGIIEDSL